MKSKKMLWFILMLLSILITILIAGIMEMCGFIKTKYDFIDTNMKISEFTTILKEEKFEIFSETQIEGSNRFYTKARKGNLYIKVWYDKDKLIDIFEAETKNTLGFSETEYRNIEQLLAILFEDKKVASDIMKCVYECFSNFTKDYEFQSVDCDGWTLFIDKLDTEYSVNVSCQVRK